MKPTLWTELSFQDAEILERDGSIGIRVRHPALKRPRWFVRSRRGNWYSRCTWREKNSYAEGYILR